jgi:archaetidylinositol phosphate synthase
VLPPSRSNAPRHGIIMRCSRVRLAAIGRGRFLALISQACLATPPRIDAVPAEFWDGAASPAETLILPISRDNSFRVKRIQVNVTAKSERRLLTFLAANLPDWVTPDRLTALGIAGAIIVLTAQIASRHDRSFFWIASFGLVVHWLGDSLDGSLARFRKIERPKYGYFLDHTVDAFCNFIIMLGFGLTLYIRMDVALFALVGYFFLCMYVFINNHISGEMQLSFVGFGPTELRLCLIAINTGMYFCGRAGIVLGEQFFSYYDGVLLFAGVVFVTIYVVQMVKGIRALRDSA